ncbi:MAG: chemotaxis protein CheW [Caldisericia bacterium]|nr:chemotaxis protein CheW [Caldisericia bacterium]
MKHNDRYRKIEQEQILTVLELRAANQKWAIPALDIIRIIESLPVKSLPQENLAISGTIDYQNQSIPFLSLGILLENKKESNGPMVIFDHKEGHLALGLSEVYTLKRIPVSNLQLLPNIIEDTRFSSTIAKCYFDEENNIVPIVDLKYMDF